MQKKSVILVLFWAATLSVSAQWRLGLTGGGDLNYRQMGMAYATNVTREPNFGGTCGISAQYNFFDWLGIRADYQMVQRGYTDRNQAVDTYTKYTQNYHLLPVEVSFSFGGKQVRGYVNVGGYVGHWTAGQMAYTNEGSREVQTAKYEFAEYNGVKVNRRIDAGLAGTLGVVYTHPTVGVYVSLELVAYYGLVNNHRNTSAYFKQPAYDTTGALQLGIGYRFPNKKDKEAKQ